MITHDIFEQWREIGHKFVDLNDHGFERLLAREREHLICEHSCFFSSGGCSLKRFLEFWIRCFILSDGAVQTYQDCSQQIIEIMCHAACQLSNCLHFLSLPKHVFHQLPLLNFLSKSRQGGISLLHM